MLDSRDNHYTMESAVKERRESDGERNTVGQVFNNCVAFFANSMIACVDAAAYGVLLLDLLLRFN